MDRWAAVLALIGTALGSGGLAAFLNRRATGRKIDGDALASTAAGIQALVAAAEALVDPLTSRLANAEGRLAELETNLHDARRRHEAELDAARADIRTARIELTRVIEILNSVLTGVGILTRQLEAAGIEPAWTPPDVRELINPPKE